MTTTTMTTMKTLPPMRKKMKDSFDRFGDDLSDILLAQLPTLEDRFRCECVCRQWQRLVYNSHRQMIIDQKFTDKLAKNKTMTTQRLAQVMAKCSNILAINIISNGFDHWKTVDPVMDVLVNHNNIIDGNIQSFEVHIRKRWTHSELMTFIGQLTQFHRLRHLAIDCPAIVLFNNRSRILPIVANKCPVIRSLWIRIMCFVEQDFMDIIDSVRLFSQLDSLHLNVYTMLTDVFSLKSLATNCPRLKYLTIEYLTDIDFTDVDLINKQLKRPAIITKIGPNYE